MPAGRPYLTSHGGVMAQLSLGEARWRMLRRALKKKTFTYTECRNQTRFDRSHFDWFVEHGFFVQTGPERYEVTEKGRQAADLGMYEWEPPRRRP